MTERLAIINEHVELAREQMRLMLNTSIEQSAQVTKRMQDIQEQINRCIEIELSWDESVDKEKSKLQMISQAELAIILNTSRDSVTFLRETGVIPAIKTGKSYMFSQEAVEQFQKLYAGYDVSNKVNALKAKQKVTAATVTKNKLIY